MLGSHLLEQDFQSPAGRAEGAVGGWCWQPALLQTSPGTSQLFPACVLSHLLPVSPVPGREGASCGKQEAALLLLAGPSLSTPLLPPFTEEASRASRSPGEELGRSAAVLGACTP